MNATSLEELRAQAAKSPQSPAETAAPSSTHPSDEKMEQIRQLLFGDKLEANAGRLATLESRQKEFEHMVLQRLDVISQRLDALSRDVLADRRAAFDELSRAMHDLGNRVRGI
jgi:hypothetical protein